VFRTGDGGKTWQKVLFVNDTTGAADLVMVPGNPRVLFAGMWQFVRHPWELVSGGAGSGIFRSTDGGLTWERLKQGLPAGPLGRIAVGVGATNPTHVYALVEAKRGLLWDSHDLGDHWAPVSDNHALDARPFYFSLITVSPVDEQQEPCCSNPTTAARRRGRSTAACTWTTMRCGSTPRTPSACSRATTVACTSRRTARRAGAS
jgi:photosystem II stability/assembly factor-like uncharacterized protein